MKPCSPGGGYCKVPDEAGYEEMKPCSPGKPSD